MNRYLVAALLVMAPPAFADDHAHHHGLIDMTAKRAPTLTMTAERDPVGGWNVHLKTSRFRFAPEHVNGVHVAGEGHAHLYVDGKKVARLYGSWFHLPAQAPGKHVLRASLNANSHQEISAGGKRVEAVVEIEQ